MTIVRWILLVFTLALATYDTSVLVVNAWRGPRQGLGMGGAAFLWCAIWWTAAVALQMWKP